MAKSSTSSSHYALRCNESLDAHYDALSGALDAITGEMLDADHIEWISPDRKLKICYNVVTLFKCAKKSQFGVQLRQPPHFRGPMAADMRLEIQERFPDEYAAFLAAARQREAVEAEEAAAEAAEAAEERALQHHTLMQHMMLSFQFLADEDISDRVAEQENLQTYYRDLAMTGDLVVCPICFDWLTTRYRTDDHEGLLENDEDENPDEPFQNHIDNDRDPIRLLTKCAEGNVDGVNGCSNFLSTTMKRMHVHLKECHNIRPSQLTRKCGCSSLLNTCKLRTADGLVQRHWRTLDDKRVVSSFWSCDGFDRKSMYFDLLFATQRKEEAMDRGENDDVEQRSAWSVLGERSNLYSTTTVRTAYTTLLQPFTTELHEDDRNAIVNDSDVSEDDEHFNHAALDRKLDEEKELSSHEHTFFARKTPSVGDVVEVRWELETGGLRWYKAEVIQTRSNGGSRPTNWKVRYEEDHTEANICFAEEDENWRVVKLASSSDDDDDDDDGKSETSENDDDQNVMMRVGLHFSDDDSSRRHGSEEDVKNCREEEHMQHFPHYEGEQLHILYDADDGEGPKTFSIQILKIKRANVKVLYLCGNQETEVIQKEDFDLRVVVAGSKVDSKADSKVDKTRTPQKVKAASINDDDDDDDDDDVVGFQSSSKKRSRVFEDVEDEEEDNLLLKSSQKRRRVTPLTTANINKLLLDESDSDSDTIQPSSGFAKRKGKQAMLLEDSDSDD